MGEMGGLFYLVMLRMWDVGVGEMGGLFYLAC